MAWVGEVADMGEVAVFVAVLAGSRAASEVLLDPAAACRGDALPLCVCMLYLGWMSSVLV
jgi:hypothetical protein